MNNKSIKYIYKFAENYNPIYSNGAYGGGTPNGEIIINFYLERQPIPYSEIRQIDETGQLSDEVILEPAGHDINVVRYVSTGVVLSLEKAKSIHEWLGHHIKHFEFESGGEKWP